MAIGPRDTDALLFLDETGTSNYFKPSKLAHQKSLIAAGKKPDTSVIFGLAGVLFRRADYKRFHTSLRAVKTRRFGTSLFTLHEYDIRKMKQPPFTALKDDAVWAAFERDLSALIARTPFLVIVATLDKIAMQYRYDDPHRPYEYCLHVILERGVNEKAYGDTCRIIAENRQAGLNKELIAEFLRLQTEGGTIDGSPTVAPEEFRSRFDPTIVFREKRDLDSGLEMADLAVGPVTRWLHDLNTRVNRDVLPLVRPKLRRSKSGKLRGYGIKCLPEYPATSPV